MVKTKLKQKPVELINADDFFETLHRAGFKRNSSCHQNLMQFLCLDASYVDRIYIKKLGKAVAEFAQNEDFRAIGHMVGCYNSQKSKELEQISRRPESIVKEEDEEQVSTR